MTPLAFLPEGSSAIIVNVRGGRGLMRRLTDLGLTPGIRVRMLRSQGYGPVLIEVRGTRLALGRGVAMKILVKVGA